MADLISVIVRSCKELSLLDRCLRSILNQTYQDFEILLIDDGTLNEKFASRIKTKKIKILNLAQSSLLSQKNLGLEHALGKYVVFVNGYDYIEPTMLEVMHKAIKDNDAELAICNYKSIEIDGKENERKNLQLPKSIIEDEFWEFLYNTDYDLFSLNNNKMYSIYLFTDVRYPLDTQSGDEEVLHRIVSATTRIAVVSEKLYVYTNYNRPSNQDLQYTWLDNLKAHESRINYFIAMDEEKLALQDFKSIKEEYIEAFKFKGDREYKDKFAILKKNLNESLGLVNLPKNDKKNLLAGLNKGKFKED